MSTETLLIELGTEELPPTALKSLSDTFTNTISEELIAAGLIDDAVDSRVAAYASPRRLAVTVSGVKAAQTEQTVERRGPAVAAAFDAEGNPTPAAEGFAKSCGVAVGDLQRLKTDKGEWLSYTVSQPGDTLANLLNGILSTAVKRLPIPKRMRWGDHEAEFVRPAHWLVVLHGDTIVPTSVLDLSAGRKTRGHRFHSNGNIDIDHAEHYVSTLKDKGHVIVDFAYRQSLIRDQISKLAKSIDANTDPDQDLLDEVTALVEWPVALLGKFDAEFLQVPSECLISSMRDHQKYFHLRDSDGNLLPNFITVSNIDSREPDRVVAGNERVLRARLSDARFFWEADKKGALEELLPKLDAVLFHAKLGSLGQKTQRLMQLTANIAELIGAEQNLAVRAAQLCKADLVSNMVGEFDKLQGVMGHYYADLDGEAATVGEAIEQHYWPRFAGDQLPQTTEAQAVALADRLDSLVGIYAAGEIPTGDKDPYSLRRSALGILRILIEQKLPLDLSELVGSACELLIAQGIDISNETQTEIVNFIQSRLTAYYQSQDISTPAINSVMACTPGKPLEFDMRLDAVRSFNQLEEAADLAAANKRINNILKKQQQPDSAQVDESLLEESAEKALWLALVSAERESGALFDQGEFSDGLKALAKLRNPVDEFFENVMVMSEDSALKTNRVALLQRLQALFWRVADISQLQQG